MENNTNLRSNIILIVNVVFAIIGFVAIYFLLFKPGQVQVDDLRKQIIEKDSLIKVGEGHFSKLVNDYSSEKQLNSILKASNSVLYTQLKSYKDNPLIYSQIEASFKPKKDNPVSISKQDPKLSWTQMVDFYPQEKDYFIKHTISNKGDSTATAQWDFTKIKLDLVISETKNKIYKADFVGPDFITVNSIKVNSLPLSNVIPDNFDWLVGGGVLWNGNTNQTKPVVSGGIRYKKSNLIIQSTGDYQGISYIRAF